MPSWTPALRMESKLHANRQHRQVNRKGHKGRIALVCVFKEGRSRPAERSLYPISAMLVSAEEAPGLV